MDIDERKIGQWPNVAIEAGTPPAEAMERYGVEPGGKPPESDGEGVYSPDSPEDETPTGAVSGPQEGLERVIAADGLPIEVGQVLYGQDGKAWTVDEIDPRRHHPVLGSHAGMTRALKAGWLRHATADKSAAYVKRPARNAPTCDRLSGEPCAESYTDARMQYEKPRLLSAGEVGHVTSEGRKVTFPEKDTREKLRRYFDDQLEDFAIYARNTANGLRPNECYEFYRREHEAPFMDEILDRQAAITEREVVGQREEQCAQLVNDMNAARQSLDATKRAIARAGATWTEDADGSVAVVFAPDVERMQGVVKAQADAFKALERQLADTRDALESELRLHGPTEDKLHELLNALDELEITHIWHDDVGMWEVCTPEERGPDPDVDAIEDALVRFAWELMESDSKLAEHRLVRAYAREIAGEA